MTLQLTEQIERRLIVLQAKKERHEVERGAVSGSPVRELAPLHLAATDGGIDELEWVLRTMLLLQMGVPCS